MTVHMKASEFKRLQKRIVPTGMSKSDLMTFHLLLVEAVLGRRITPNELRSARYAQSRNKFVELMMGWKAQKEDE